MYEEACENYSGSRQQPLPCQRFVSAFSNGCIQLHVVAWKLSKFYCCWRYILLFNEYRPQYKSLTRKLMFVLQAVESRSRSRSSRSSLGTIRVLLPLLLLLSSSPLNYIWKCTLEKSFMCCSSPLLSSALKRCTVEKSFYCLSSITSSPL